jgi:hypothetical protein
MSYRELENRVKAVITTRTLEVRGLLVGECPF